MSRQGGRDQASAGLGARNKRTEGASGRGGRSREGGMDGERDRPTDGGKEEGRTERGRDRGREGGRRILKGRVLPFPRPFLNQVLAALFNVDVAVIVCLG